MIFKMEGKPNELPLVSIIVITYNSAKYVLETLESAKAQTYENIELIVSDDCSTDNTVEICKDWIEINKGRFVSVKLLTREQNGGIASNCNRGFSFSTGEWIKFIAGDDILLDNCIMYGVEYIRENKETKIFASNGQMFAGDYSDNSSILEPYVKEPFSHPDAMPDLQLKEILLNNSINAASVFISRYVYELNNGFDEGVTFEDYAFWIKTIVAGIRIDFLPKTTVAYRVLPTSASHDPDKTVQFEFAKSVFKIREFYMNRSDISDEIKKKIRCDYYSSELVFGFKMGIRSQALDACKSLKTNNCYPMTIKMQILIWAVKSFGAWSLTRAAWLSMRYIKGIGIVKFRRSI